MIKVISFDIGNTLIIKNGESKINKIEKILNLSRDVFRTEYKDSFLTNELSIENQIENFLTQLKNKNIIDSSKNIDMIKNEILKVFNKICNSIQIEEIYDDAKAVIQELHSRGYTVIALSNANKNSTIEKEKMKKILNVDNVIYSYEVGYYKPNSKIYKYVEEMYSVLPQEILHIGDSLNSDYYGALHNNWNAILFDNNEKYKNMNVQRISNINEVLNYI